MKPFGLAGKPRPVPCGCCWYTREDCPYVSAKQIYRRRQRKAERQRQRSTIVMAVSEFR
ncbi:hypothetical protein JGS09_24295 [Enterobacter cloacae]|nr:hypothetical protein [Enterobacter cloacae]